MGILIVGIVTRTLYLRSLRYNKGSKDDNKGTNEAYLANVLRQIIVIKHFPLSIRSSGKDICLPEMVKCGKEWVAPPLLCQSNNEGHRLMRLADKDGDMAHHSAAGTSRCAYSRYS
jgi:hypothetical protein